MQLKVPELQNVSLKVRFENFLGKGTDMKVKGTQRAIGCTYGYSLRN
jgi:hypothetical protein